jgi:hypothetical protein
MKRKIAFLLAVVLTVAILPTNVFASSTVTVYDRGSTSFYNTVFVERTANKANQPALTVPTNLGGAVNVGGDTTHAQNAPYFVVNLTDGIETGQQFRISLAGNGSWALGDYGTGSTNAVSAPRKNITDSTGEFSGQSGRSLTEAVRYMDTNKGQYVTPATVGSRIGASVTGQGTYVRYGATPINYATQVAPHIASSVRGTVTSPEGYFGVGGSAIGTLGTLDESSPFVSADRTELPYTMSFTDSKNATITVLQTVKKEQNGIFVIPMIIFASQNATVTAQTVITDFTQSTISVSNSAAVPVVEGVSGSVTYSLSPNINNYELFPISTITIAETRAGIMKSRGYLEMAAPTGYSFITNYSATQTTTVGGNIVHSKAPNRDDYTSDSDWLGAYMAYWFGQVAGTVTIQGYDINNFVGPDTDGDGNPGPLITFAVGGGSKGNPTLVSASFRAGRNGIVDASAVRIEWDGLVVSSGTPGELQIQNLPLMLKADEGTATGDVNVRMFQFNYDGTDQYDNDKWAKITDGAAVKAGTRVQYGISFTSGGAPTIYNGQYERGTGVSQEEGENDAWHKVGHITFKENLPSSWLANRQTVFTVPDGVKIVKIAFNNAWDVTKIFGGGYKQDTMFDKNWSGGKEYKNNGNIVEAIQIGALSEDNGGLDNGTYSAGTPTALAGYLALDDHSFTLSGLVVPQTDKRMVVGFRMDMWVTVEPGWEGDITLTASGPGLGAEIVDPVILGVAKNPIKINVAEVTDIKIGYQHQTTSDFSITEDKAGILRRGDTVKLSLTDNVHTTDMSFIDANFDVTDGDLKIGNKKVAPYSNSTANSTSLGTIGSTGTISFDIAAASSKASTISFSNVQVKIDRTIPETNLTPYKILVWGNAVAANYDSTANPRRATHAVPGIMADYIKVATLANSNALSSKIEVPIGSNTIKVRGKDVEIDAAAFIDPENDSTMVPVRFVTEALMDQGSVNWDGSTRTVTIYTDSRVIQFTIGSDQIIVNGVASTMTSADGSGRPVKAQIANERSFIPFRALGDALGVPVAWDAETQTAIYNP